MSKLKKSTLNLATFNKPTAKTFSNQAIVSINHQNGSASCQIAASFDNQCSIDKQDNFQAPGQLKKKRAALENISNSNSSIPQAVNNEQLLTKSTHGVNPKSDQSNSYKKSRFGTSVFSAKTTKPTRLTENKKAINNKSECIKTKEENKIEVDSVVEQVANNLDPKVKNGKLTDPQNVLGWLDIDLGDENDEFSSADYVKQIFKYYRKREEQFTVDDYLKEQPHLNKHMRSLLVDWMVEVQQQLEFNHEVLYLSVKLLDLYLNKRVINKEKLQLLGGAAMFIACKFEERMPPIIDDFIFVSDNAYERKDLIKMEIEILKTVKFDIGVPLSYTFLRRYSKCIRADMKFLTLARYILELSLQDYQFAYVNDSLKACASLYLAMKMVVQFEIDNPGQTILCSENLTSTEWNETLVYFTGSFLKQFINLVPAMNQLIKVAPQSKYNTIYKKYSHHVFHEVAKVTCLTDSQLEKLMQNCAQNSIGCDSE